MSPPSSTGRHLWRAGWSQLAVLPVACNVCRRCGALRGRQRGRYVYRHASGGAWMRLAPPCPQSPNPGATR